MNISSKNVFWAIPLIFAGIIWFLKNTGNIPSELFYILLSWQILIIYVGFFSLFNGRSWHGLIAIAVGGIFLLSKLDLLDRDWLRVYWPLILVVVGIAQLFKPHNEHCFSFGKMRFDQKKSMYSNTDYTSKNGFIEIDNTFGSIQQIVLDPVFKGADVRNFFGGVLLDLRRTKLEDTQTFINLECFCGGIELYLPPSWNLQSQVNNLLGGCEDKRYNASIVIDQEHTIIIRGKVTLGGIELKS